MTGTGGSDEDACVRANTARVPPTGVLATATVIALALIAGLFVAATYPSEAPGPLGQVTGGRAEVPIVGEFPLAAPYRGRDRSDPRDVNIVEIVADDMRWDDLQHAPRLRRLVAQQGVTMRNAFASYPLCCPARASFFSGQETHNHGVYNVKDPSGYQRFDDRRSIATALQDAGYRTGLVGKYLNGYGGHEALAPRLRQRAAGVPTEEIAPVVSQYYVPDGWDEWRGALNDARCAPACGGTYTYFDYAYSDDGVPTSAGRGRYSTSVIGDQARDLARRFHNQRLRTGDPFFLSVNFVAPHNGPGRGQRPTRFPFRNSLGEVEDLGGPAVPRRILQHPAVRAIERGQGLLPGGGSERDVSDKPGRLAKAKRFTPSKRRALLSTARHRAGAVRLMDRRIGELIAQLKRDGEWGRTVLVFWSDNGYYQGEHGRAEGKIDPYEPVLRIPMMFTGPGLRAGTMRYDPMTVVDLTATLLDVAGAEAPQRADGWSMLPVLRRGDRGWTHAVLTEAAAARIEPGTSRRFRGDERTSIGVRTPRFLYLRHRSGAREIYDLRTDPEQWRNRAVDERWMRANRVTVAMLDRAWHRVADCVGVRRCKAPLPPELAADVESNRRVTQAYFRHIAQTYRPDRRGGGRS